MVGAIIFVAKAAGSEPIDPEILSVTGTVIAGVTRADTGEYEVQLTYTPPAGKRLAGHCTPLFGNAFSQTLPSLGGSGNLFSVDYNDDPVSDQQLFVTLYVVTDV